MAVIKVIKNRNYSIMSNYHLQDQNLSLKAKGLLSMVLTLPEDWNYTIKGLISIVKEGETAVTTALNELKQQGYVEIIKKLPNETSSGRIEYEYIIYEIPEKQGGDFLGLEKGGLYKYTKDKDILSNATVDTTVSSVDLKNISNRVAKGSTKVEIDSIIINRLSNIFKTYKFNHKLNPEDPSKTILSIVKKIQDIYNGKYMDWELTSDFKDELKKYNIYNNINKNIANGYHDLFDIIEQVLDDLLLARKADYYPIDKNKIPKSFNDFLYNDYSKFSWFLNLAAKGAIKIKDAVSKESVKNLSKTFMKVLDEHCSVDWSKSTINKIAPNVCKMEKWFKSFGNEMQLNIMDYWVSYTEYITDITDGGSPEAGHFTLYGPTHRRVLGICCDDYNINFDFLDTKEERKKGYKNDY